MQDRLWKFDYKLVFIVRNSWIGKHRRLESLCWYALTFPHRFVRLCNLIRHRAPKVIIKNELKMMVGIQLYPGVYPDDKQHHSA